ncbi:hypothetical protein BUALT_Bualt12G0129200 [Buddleja alternifolia]|uniref:Uncharacterized protein n=1 Tax=Buddleja alternifolia TaxID=168488 RepID=A0AAV6WZB5_9LAMI|nr:hypothetical protein BUALT_Bualt12G0129200 [Buddleja alternifolia]
MSSGDRGGRTSGGGNGVRTGGGEGGMQTSDNSGDGIEIGGESYDAFGRRLWFFCPPICERSRNVIPRLLRSVDRLQAELKNARRRAKRERRAC